MSGRPSRKSAEIAVFRRVRGAPGKSRKRIKKAFFLRYPQICLSPHLLNPHLQHSKGKHGANFGPNFGANFGENFVSKFATFFGNFVQQKGGANHFLGSCAAAGATDASESACGTLGVLQKCGRPHLSKPHGGARTLRNQSIGRC